MSNDEMIIKLLNDGLNYDEVAREAHCSKTKVCKIAKDNEVKRDSSVEKLKKYEKIIECLRQLKINDSRDSKLRSLGKLMKELELW